MTVAVDRARCVGSRTCVEIAPDLFVIDDGRSRVLRPEEPGSRRERNDEATAEDFAEAIDSCPVQAILGGEQ